MTAVKPVKSMLTDTAMSTATDMNTAILMSTDMLTTIIIHMIMSIRMTTVMNKRPPLRRWWIKTICMTGWGKRVLTRRA